jgi:hypothetical protein
MSYRRGRIPRGGLTEAVRNSSAPLLMDRGNFQEHTQEEIAEFLDTSERLFRNPDRFSTTIPALGSASIQSSSLLPAAVLPSLRRLQPRVVPVMREHPAFRYVLRGMPSCPHANEAALVSTLRIHCGLELDREAGGLNRWLFVRDDEKTVAEAAEHNTAVLPTNVIEAAYNAPAATANVSFEQFLADDTTAEDRHAILEDLGVVCIDIDQRSWTVVDWWVEFG